MSGQILSLRPSGLDLFWHCGASARLLDGVGNQVTHIREESPEMSAGTADHALIARGLLGEELPEDAWVARRAVAMMGNELADVSIPDPLWIECDTGVTCAGYNIIGSADVLGESKAAKDTIGYVIDWKTGNEERPAPNQLRAYAYGNFGCMKCETCKLVTVWPRLGRYETEDFTRADSEAWLADLERRIHNAEKAEVFSPGEHCGRCPRFFDCPGRQQLVRGTLSELATGVAYPLSRENVLAAKSAVSMARKAADALDGMIREFVRASGPVTLEDGSGRVLGFVPVKKRECDPVAAWPILAQRLTETEIAAAMKISLTKCEEAVKAKATGPRGCKSAARKELLDALDAAGAITIKPEEQLRIHRPDDPAESE